MISDEQLKDWDNKFQTVSSYDQLSTKSDGEATDAFTKYRIDLQYCCNKLLCFVNEKALNEGVDEEFNKRFNLLVPYVSEFETKLDNYLKSLRDGWPSASEYTELDCRTNGIKLRDELLKILDEISYKAASQDTNFYANNYSLLLKWRDEIQTRMDSIENRQRDPSFMNSLNSDSLRDMRKDLDEVKTSIQRLIINLKEVQRYKPREYIPYLKEKKHGWLSIYEYDIEAPECAKRKQELKEKYDETLGTINDLLSGEEAYNLRQDTLYKNSLILCINGMRNDLLDWIPNPELKSHILERLQSFTTMRERGKEINDAYVTLLSEINNLARKGEFTNAHLNSYTNKYSEISVQFDDFNDRIASILTYTPPLSSLYRSKDAEVLNAAIDDQASSSLEMLKNSIISNNDLVRKALEAEKAALVDPEPIIPKATLLINRIIELKNEIERDDFSLPDFENKVNAFTALLKHKDFAPSSEDSLVNVTATRNAIIKKAKSLNFFDALKTKLNKLDKSIFTIVEILVEDFTRRYGSIGKSRYPNVSDIPPKALKEAKVLLAMIEKSEIDFEKLCEKIQNLRPIKNACQRHQEELSGAAEKIKGQELITQINGHITLARTALNEKKYVTATEHCENAVNNWSELSRLKSFAKEIKSLSDTIEQLKTDITSTSEQDSSNNHIITRMETILTEMADSHQAIEFAITHKNYDFYDNDVIEKMEEKIHANQDLVSDRLQIKDQLSEPCIKSIYLARDATKEAKIRLDNMKKAKAAEAEAAEAAKAAEAKAIEDANSARKAEFSRQLNELNNELTIIWNKSRSLQDPLRDEDQVTFESIQPDLTKSISELERLEKNLPEELNLREQVNNIKSIINDVNPLLSPLKDRIDTAQASLEKSKKHVSAALVLMNNQQALVKSSDPDDIDKITSLLTEIEESTRLSRFNRDQALALCSTTIMKNSFQTDITYLEDIEMQLSANLAAAHANFNTRIIQSMGNIIEFVEASLHALVGDVEKDTINAITTTYKAHKTVQADRLASIKQTSDECQEKIREAGFALDQLNTKLNEVNAVLVSSAPDDVPAPIDVPPASPEPSVNKAKDNPTLSEKIDLLYREVVQYIKRPGEKEKKKEIEKFLERLHKLQKLHKLHKNDSSRDDKVSKLDANRLNAMKKKLTAFNDTLNKQTKLPSTRISIAGAIPAKILKKDRPSKAGVSSVSPPPASSVIDKPDATVPVVSVSSVTASDKLKQDFNKIKLELNEYVEKVKQIDEQIKAQQSSFEDTRAVDGFRQQLLDLLSSVATLNENYETFSTKLSKEDQELILETFALFHDYQTSLSENLDLIMTTILTDEELKGAPAPTPALAKAPAKAPIAAEPKAQAVNDTRVVALKSEIKTIEDLCKQDNLLAAVGQFKKVRSDFDKLEKDRAEEIRPSIVNVSDKIKQGLNGKLQTVKKEAQAIEGELASDSLEKAEQAFRTISAIRDNIGQIKRLDCLAISEQVTSCFDEMNKLVATANKSIANYKVHQNKSAPASPVSGVNTNPPDEQVTRSNLIQPVVVEIVKLRLQEKSLRKRGENDAANQVESLCTVLEGHNKMYIKLKQYTLEEYKTDVKGFINDQMQPDAVLVQHRGWGLPILEVLARIVDILTFGKSNIVAGRNNFFNTTSHKMLQGTVDAVTNIQPDNTSENAPKDEALKPKG